MINQELAKQFIVHRKKQGRSLSTINCDYSALRKYFKDVLFIQWSLRKIPRPRAEHSLPPTLSTQDIINLINNAATYKHQVLYVLSMPLA
jgi:site-specific recombinase XerD